ncbi:MAG: tetratricopeptide repeat protein, partial [Magnetococcales bacterium]|nr:tetratricopeptide repeat protein [Magnetococcales bacterium]
MKIISFFSFKGGVGRTALLVNLATYWATRGRVVVIVDMDLAAPGVSYSPLLEASPLEDDRPPCGVHELLAAYYAGKKAGDPYSFGFFPASHCFRRMKPPDSLGHAWPLGGAVLVLPAGEAGIELPTRLGKDSPHYYPPKTGRVGENPDEMSLRAFAKLFRQDLENYRLPTAGSPRPIDLVLIDCRTGWPELLDLSLGYLADHMVLVSGFNQQNQQGLRHTLHALRKGQAAPRIPFGKYSSTLTVAFSHIPVHIHEDQASLEALRQSEKILEEFRLPPPLATQQPEALPPVYHLPYTPRLVSSDLPLFPSQDRNHPYIRVLLTIADQLEQTGVLAEELLQIEKELIRVGGKPLPVQDGSASNDMLDFPVPITASLDELLQLPKWYWPWFGSDVNPQAAGWKRIAEFIPTDGVSNELLDTFLDGLCFAISLELEEKKNILQKYQLLSTWQHQELLSLFNTERQKIVALHDSYKRELFETLFNRQKEWAILLLGEEEGIKQFLKPLGEHIESGSAIILFRTWDNLLLYHKLLKNECENNRKLSYSSENDACILPKQNHLISKNVNLKHIIYDNPLKYWLNDRKKIIPHIEEKNNDVWHALAYFASNPLNYGNDDEGKYRIISSMDREQPEFWSEFGDQLKGKSDKLEEAEAAYRHAIGLNDKDSTIWNKLGVLLLRSKRYSEAEEAFNKAIDINPLFVKAWNNLGNCLIYFKAYEKAENAYKQAITIDKHYAFAWSNLGNLLQYQLSRCEEAENAYKQAISIDGNYARPWSNLGNLLQYRFNRYEEAENAYKQAIKIDERFAHAWSNLGNLFQYKLNRYEEAENAYKQAIKIDDCFAHAWSNLGNLLQY